MAGVLQPSHACIPRGQGSQAELAPGSPVDTDDGPRLVVARAAETGGDRDVMACAISARTRPTSRHHWQALRKTSKAARRRGTSSGWMASSIVSRQLSL